MKRFGKALLGLAVLFAPAYWWLVVHSEAPEGTFVLDLAELRRLANELPGEKPHSLAVEHVATLEFPRTAVVAGDGWSTTTLPVFSYQVRFPDQTVIIDATLDRTGAKDAVFYDDAAFARVQRALEQASRIVITHAHFDHLGGIATHPKLDALTAALALTPEQLQDPKERDPLIITDDVRAKLKLVSYGQGFALAPGVVLWKSPGHTPGSQLVFVQRADGEEFLFLGDVAWHRENWQQVRERARLATLLIGEDRAAVLRQLAAIKALSQLAPALHVVPGHDGPVVEALIKGGQLAAHFP